MKKMKRKEKGDHLEYAVECSDYHQQAYVNRKKKKKKNKEIEEVVLKGIL